MADNDAATIRNHEAEESQGLPFFVVGVGASAGGLEAYTELLDGLSASPGMAFLLVSHLDPEHKSLLAPILARVCRMPVVEVTEGMAVEIDRVYVIPPGTNMEMADGHLTLTPRAPRPIPHMPIDVLLRSLSELQKNRAVGVILSGNGTDGVIALQAIKAAGGVTFAQDEESARYTSMPRAAAHDGNVDHVMRPSAIAAELERIARHPYGRPEGPGLVPAPPQAMPDPVAEMIHLLRHRTGVDFTNYKQSTIRRRILRRMALRNIQEPGDYLRLLREDNSEIQNLYQDLLIRVTQFFRDTEAFESLRVNVLPTLVSGRPPGTVIRVWVAGCSTGEEAYSIAMTLVECLDDQADSVSIKILATDLNETALERARAGVYLDNIEIDVSPTRLRRFFVRKENQYHVSKAIRDLCIFSRHNMSSDPPFSRLDLISCRNVLIYMNATLQKRVFPLLHYALNPGGYLFLGSSENISTGVDLFDVVDGRHRIFARSFKGVGASLDFHRPFDIGTSPRPSDRDDVIPLWNALDVQKEADRVLLSRYAPVGVVADETMTVLQFRGRTAPYLEPAPGMASLDLYRMLREGLLAEVRSAVARARAENVVVTREDIRITEGDSERLVRLDVVPFKVPPSGVRFFLVLFQDAASDDRAVSIPEKAREADSADGQVARLQQEIGALRDYLQSVIEEQESTNEELKSANEEILSANEELQSTNEELQTAKEEAQSTNEELETVNDELRHRNLELARVNNDLINLLGGVNIPIVMVSRDLRVRRFTPMAEKSFNLIPSDVGRPISDIKPNLAGVDLPALITSVIDTLNPHEGNVVDQNGRWHSLRIRPYITTENMIDGATIVLVDIDSIRRQLDPPAGPGDSP